MPKPVPPPATVTPTSWQSVGVALVVGIGLGWSLFTALDRFTGEVPQLPLAVTVVIAVFAAVVGVEAVRTHRTIQVRRLPVPPRRAVALLVLGKACLLGGTALVGGYAAVAAFLWRRLEVNLPRERLVSPVVAVVASAALAVAGAFLERSCRIPRPRKEDATPSTIPGSPHTPD
nr:DUF3180 domain-containing protein [Propionicimonas sp.]